MVLGVFVFCFSHSAALYLLIGEFCPFTFKIITDKYWFGPAIWHIYSCCLFWISMVLLLGDFSAFTFFHDADHLSLCVCSASLSITCKAGWEVTNSSTVCLGRSLFHPHLWMRVWPGKIFWVGSFFPPLRSWIYLSFLSCSVGFLLRNLSSESSFKGDLAFLFCKF